MPWGQELTLRILMYSCGMGGALRCLAIASHVSDRLPAASFLALTDLPILGRFALPQNFDYVHMPALGAGDVELTPRLRSESAASRLRRTIVSSTALTYQPDLILVDRHPLGLHGELASTLARARERNPGVRLVVGLPDVLGDPEAVRAAWTTGGVGDALRSLFDEVWVYGTPDVFDTAAAYGVPDDAPLHYTGYFEHSIEPGIARSKVTREGLNADEPVVLVSAGSGKGGFPLLSTYLDFLEKSKQAVDFQSHLVCGPFMSGRERRALEERSRGMPSVKVNTFHTSLLPYLSVAQLVVSNFGYNTCCELLSFGKPAVVIPSEGARAEQTLRARPMWERGLVELLESDELDRERLASVVMEHLRRTAGVSVEISLEGLDVIAARIERDPTAAAS